MQRSGLLTATVRLVAQGETVATTTSAGTPAALELKRFGHFNGAITRNGSALGKVVSAEITWDLVGRLGGQLRVLPGAVIGWDMTAVLALGDALGVPPLAMAELLPVIEAVMVQKLNAEIAVNGAQRVSP